MFPRSVSAVRTIGGLILHYFSLSIFETSGLASSYFESVKFDNESLSVGPLVCLFI